MQQVCNRFVQIIWAVQTLAIPSKIGFTYIKVYSKMHLYYHKLPGMWQIVFVLHILLNHFIISATQNIYQ